MVRHLRPGGNLQINSRQIIRLYELTYYLSSFCTSGYVIQCHSQAVTSQAVVKQGFL
jgi:hypothetical protein